MSRSVIVWVHSGISKKLKCLYIQLCDAQCQWTMDLSMPVKVKWSHYRHGVAQRVGRVIALLFNDCGTRRGWVVSSTTRPHFTPGKDPVPIVWEAGWAPGPVWMGGKSCPHRNSILDRPARSQSLYRMSYSAHFQCQYLIDCDWIQDLTVLTYWGLNKWALCAPHQFKGALLLC